MPSVCQAANDKRVSLAVAMGPYIEEQALAFLCPGDILLNSPPHERYFDREGLSYEYDSTDRLVRRDRMNNIYKPLTRQEVQERVSDPNDPEAGKLSLVVMASDYDAFHGPKGDVGARCIVFADGHADAP
jgi:hypothetical protein